VNYKKDHVCFISIKQIIHRSFLLQATVLFLVQCLVYALKTARQVPPADIVVTNDFWMPALLPWMNAKAGKVVASIARFPKKQFFLYKQCAAIAPVSESVARGVREQTPSIAGKVTVVPNCVDEVFLEETKRLRDKELNVQRDQEAKSLRDGKTEERPVRILFVGRIHPEKGLELLAQALRLLAGGDQRPKDEETKGPHKSESLKLASPRSEGEETKRLSGERTDWECFLVGPVAEAEGGGGEAFLARIRELTRGLPVTIEAPIYGLDKLAAFYSTGDVLVYPSIAELGEAMPLAPLEGMARGLVPVVSDIAAFREYLEPEVNGIVFNHRNGQGPATLARVLNDLVTDADKRARLGAAARATAEKFSPAAIADKYLQLFEKVVSGT
jgi:glycosyltransferase involved in cell wall biosynthesis